MEGSMKIKANGIDINYEIAGEGDCLVLIHGYPDTLDMWYNQVPEFSKKYKVLTVDVRGFGKSEITSGPYSMALFAEDLYGLLKALDIERACVLGFSMGGMIALTFVMSHPEMAAGLVMANSAVATGEVQPSPEDVAAMEERRKMMAEVFARGDMEAICEMMTVSAFSPGFKEKDPATFQKFKDIKMQNRIEPLQSIMQAMAQARTGPPPDLKQVKCPVLIIVGEADGLMAANNAESMARIIEKSTLKVFPTGHASALEAPQDFNQAVLDFMETVY